MLRDVFLKSQPCSASSGMMILGSSNNLSRGKLSFCNHFFLRRSARTDRTEKKINEQLNEIVQSAIELDKMMMCSKACFMIEWQPPAKKSHSNNRYDKEFMESDIHEVEPSSKSRVKFFMSPILLKTGTADGQKYDTTNVLAKASVVCN
jgi:hypothetical protein